MNAASALIPRAVLFVALFATPGCDNMEHQTHARPEEASTAFDNGSEARISPAGTVPRGRLSTPSSMTGEAAGVWLQNPPGRVTRALLERGRERFEIHCAVCHGSDGVGSGIVVRRGYPAPPSLQDVAARNLPAGKVFDIITHGYGIMYPADFRVTVADRWAIVAYIRALQLSRHGTLADVPAERRQALLQP